MSKRLWITTIGLVGCLSVGERVYAQDTGPAFKFDADNVVSFSPTSTKQRDASVSSDGKMRIHVDYKKLRVLATSNDEVIHEFATPHRAMASTFSPDNSQIAFADCTGNLACESTIYLHDLTRDHRTVVGSVFGVATQLSFSANGKRLAIASIYDPIMELVAKEKFRQSLGGEIAVFDLATSTKLLHLAYANDEGAAPTTKTLAPVQIAINDAGTTLLVMGKSNVAKAIDVKSRNVSMSIEPLQLAE